MKNNRFRDKMLYKPNKASYNKKNLQKRIKYMRQEFYTIIGDIEKSLATFRRFL
jgi:hypothetical protein